MPTPPERSSLSEVGSALSIAIFFCGLLLTAVATDKVNGPIPGVTVFVLGMSLTFGLVWLVGTIDFVVRQAWHRHRCGDIQPLPQTSGLAMSPLLARIVTIAVVGLIALEVRRAAGVLWGGIIIGASVLVLVILNGWRRI